MEKYHNGDVVRYVGDDCAKFYLYEKLVLDHPLHVKVKDKILKFWYTTDYRIVNESNIERTKNV